MRESCRPWPDIEAKFAELARVNSAFGPLADLSHHLAVSGFAKAGLYGSTSMHDLVLSQSPSVFDFPHLRIEYDFSAKVFRMIYYDRAGGGLSASGRRTGDEHLWQREASPSEIADAVDRFLTKRARWFRAG